MTSSPHPRPWSTFAMAAVWSISETIALLVVVAPWETLSLSRSLTLVPTPRIDELWISQLTGVVLGGVMSMWLLVLTWTILGMTSSNRLRAGDSAGNREAESSRITCDRVWLTCCLLLVCWQALILNWILGSGMLLGQAIVGLTLATSVMVLYRQIYGCHLTREIAAPTSFYNIRDLMLLTLPFAVALAIASRLLEFDGSAFRMTVWSGSFYALVWWTTLLAAMRRSFVRLLLSLSGLVILLVAINSFGLTDGTFDSDQLVVVCLFFISLYLHGVLFLAIAVSDGFRLSNASLKLS